MFYSTPADYVAAKATYAAEWPLKTDDFFPYSDCEHCYWTGEIWVVGGMVRGVRGGAAFLLRAGCCSLPPVPAAAFLCTTSPYLHPLPCSKLRPGYFTSRPTSKRYIRLATAYLQAARQLQALTPGLTLPPINDDDDHGGLGGTPVCAEQTATTAGLGEDHGKDRGEGSNSGGGATGDEQPVAAQPGLDFRCGPLDALEEAVSLTQHHDAVTGTEKQHVANDYHRRLHRGACAVQNHAHVTHTILHAPHACKCCSYVPLGLSRRTLCSACPSRFSAHRPLPGLGF